MQSVICLKRPASVEGQNVEPEGHHDMQILFMKKRFFFCNVYYLFNKTSVQQEIIDPLLKSTRCAPRLPSDISCQSTADVL